MELIVSNGIYPDSWLGTVERTWLTVSDLQRYVVKREGIFGQGRAYAQARRWKIDRDLNM